MRIARLVFPRYLLVCCLDRLHSRRRQRLFWSQYPRFQYNFQAPGDICELQAKLTVSHDKGEKGMKKGENPGQYLKEILLLIR